MTTAVVLALQLAILAATGILSVLAASSARRAASFDQTRDFDALALAVQRLQTTARSSTMKAVRAAALPPQEPAAHQASPANAPMTHDQLRALVRARNGVRQ